jgi:RNA polymerase sigma-70 factor (ECF subfamily)
MYLRMMLGRASAMPVPPSEGEAALERSAADRAGDPARLHAIVRGHYGFLWRSLRRLGVTAADVDDAAQHVLGVLARRLGDVAEGRERAFLFQTALRVAAEVRRSKRRDRLAFDEAHVEGAVDHALPVDEVLEREEARAQLDRVLDAMPLDVRAVFVLFELEQMTTNEIATVLSIPPGTVSSRLRRGREEFAAIARRLRAQSTFGGRP